MFNFTSFKSIISKDDFSNNIIKLSSVERIFEDSYIFCHKVFGFKSAVNPNTSLKTVRINSINDDIYVETKISKINNKKVKFENALMVSSGIKESKIGVRVFEVNENFENLLKNTKVFNQKLNFFTSYKGIVRTEECDQMYHMNVQFYFDKHSNAVKIFTNNIFKNKLFKIKSERCIFYKEVHEFSALEIVIFVKNLKKNHLTLQSILYCTSKHYVSAYFETEILFESDAKQILKVVDLLLQKKQNTFVNEFNFIKLRKIRPFRISKRPSENSIITCRKASNTWDLDFDGYATHKFLISCVSDAATQLFTKCGVNHKWRSDYQIGSAALDYIVRYYYYPTIGMAISLKSNFIEINEKSFKFCHHLIDDATNRVLMDIQIVAVLFDLKKRVAIKLPKSFRKKAGALLIKNQ
ncbi:MAG: hypothetical protein EVA21_06215 [Alphaproteobacteria bacterium]|nr:MAG: hypothetical protein EVA21_06215 [Alphaproteobacteria bacterium]